MKHEIDQSGSIILKPDLHDMEIISHSLIARHAQLVASRSGRHDLEQVLSLVVTLSDAVADSKRAKLTAGVAKTVVPIEDEPKERWTIRLKHLFHPPFSTRDFEEAQTVCGMRFYINSINYDRDNQPAKVCGDLFHEGRWFAAQWNRYGKCICPSLGLDAALFNLVRSSGRKTRLRLKALQAASLAVIFLVICLSI